MYINLQESRTAMCLDRPLFELNESRRLSQKSLHWGRTGTMLSIMMLIIASLSAQILHTITWYHDDPGTDTGIWKVDVNPEGAPARNRSEKQADLPKCQPSSAILVRKIKESLMRRVLCTCLSCLLQSWLRIPSTFLGWTQDVSTSRKNFVNKLWLPKVWTCGMSRGPCLPSFFSEGP